MRLFLTLLFLSALGNSVFADFKKLAPSREYEITPEDYGMEFSEIKIKTEDEMISLHCWFFPASDKSSKKIMIMADDGIGNMADNLEMASNFLSLGYNVMMFDYRGYGKSDDFAVKPKFFTYAQFYKDLDFVVNYCTKYKATLTMVDLWGHGIGAGLVIGMGANNLKIRRVIADGAYDDFEDVKARIKESTGETILFPLGYNKAELEPKFAFTEKPCTHLYGLMIIVAQNDPITGYDAMKEISKESKAKFTWYVLKGSDDNHTNFSSGTNDYFEQVKSFLDKSSK